MILLSQLLSEYNGLRVVTYHGGGLLWSGGEEGGEGREEGAAYQVHQHVGREAIGSSAPGHGHGGYLSWLSPGPSPHHPPPCSPRLTSCSCPPPLCFLSSFFLLVCLHPVPLATGFWVSALFVSLFYSLFSLWLHPVPWVSTYYRFSPSSGLFISFCVSVRLFLHTLPWRYWECGCESL